MCESLSGFESARKILWYSTSWCIMLLQLVVSHDKDSICGGNHPYHSCASIHIHLHCSISLWHIHLPLGVHSDNPWSYVPSIVNYLMLLLVLWEYTWFFFHFSCRMKYLGLLSVLTNAEVVDLRRFSWQRLTLLLSLILAWGNQSPNKTWDLRLVFWTWWKHISYKPQKFIETWNMSYIYCIHNI